MCDDIVRAGWPARGRRGGCGPVRLRVLRERRLVVFAANAPPPTSLCSPSPTGLLQFCFITHLTFDIS